jgi:hypothetical protein
VDVAYEIRVGPDQETSCVDAGGDARGRVRDGEDLVGAAGEGERGRLGGTPWVEVEGADRRGAVAVVDLRDRGARVVDAREGVDLGRGQPLSHGVGGRGHGALDVGAGTKIQQTAEHGSVHCRRCSLSHVDRLDRLRLSSIGLASTGM